MKGNDDIIATLNDLLQGEMTAVDQYFIHSRMYEDWGLNKLFERLKHETEEEFEHATALIQRILFLEGTPDLSKRDPLNIGSDVPSMLRSDLDYEYKVTAALKAAIALCEQHKDYVTREMLEKLLEDTEEDHAYWLEQQLGLIDKMGLENYIQSQT
ncbi:MAG: bacterioferritin [Gammaproteobacteria bacterium]